MEMLIPQSGDSKKIVKFENIQKVVIIGKNGSGKSRLARKFEQLNQQSHRITAQKALTIPNTIPLKSKDAAENEFLFGSAEHQQQSIEWRKQNYRWRNSSYSLNDYTQVLSLLFMKENERNAQYVDDMKNSATKLAIPLSEVDKIKDIWKQVFPQRGISLFAASVNAKYGEMQYSGQEMSDGEKVGLYFMAECLCVPKNFLIIIDEPELHLHRSIFNRLWEALENLRSDCIFIYITHDLNFAAKRQNAKYLTVERFDGTNWFYSVQNLSSEIPQAVIEDLLGAKDKILFVEGTKTSYDLQLYGAIFPNIHIVPCGGCLEVIRSVKAQKQYEKFTHIQVFGLIDRDFRSDHEIEELEKQNIYTVSLAEIENFFIVPELLEIVLLRMFPSDANGNSDVPQRMEKIEKRLNEMFLGQLDNQIQEAKKSEVQYQISQLVKNQFESIDRAIPDFLATQTKKIHSNLECQFNNAKNNYREILKLFNFKSAANALKSTMGISVDLEEFVIGLLNDKEFKGQAVAVWYNYIPQCLVEQIRIPQEKTIEKPMEP